MTSSSWIKISKNAICCSSNEREEKQTSSNIAKR